MSDAIEQLIDAGQLRLLMAIVEARSFNGAAAALGVSQPAISQQVGRLERLLGRSLFRRSPQGVAPTSDGEALVIYAKAILGLADDLRRQFRQTHGTIQLSLGMSEDFCRTALPSVMGLFLIDYPNVEIRVVTGTTKSLMAALDSKVVDLAVMRREPGSPEGTVLWTDALVWIGRAGLALPVADPVPLVVPFAPNFLRDTLIGVLRAGGRTWRVAFESFGVAALESGVQAGLGVCATPRSMPRFGSEALGQGSGLPSLPSVDYVMQAPDGVMPGTVLTFAEILKRCAAACFT